MSLRLCTVFVLLPLAAAVHADGGDAVRASFERMLAHQPTLTRSPVPAGIDPLQAALVEPLRRDPATRLAQAPGREPAPVKR